MALSLALIIILGLIFNKLFDKLKLPGLLGMLILGILIGPYGTGIISKEILNISADLRQIALIVILLRAGLGIEKETLKKVGVPAVKLSFIPGILEGFTVLFVSSMIFGLSFVEAGILAFIIAAVSPAVVVPQMLNLIENKRGADKGIPTLILTGASIDDVVAITIFSAFLGVYGGSSINITKTILTIPVSIITGILIGVVSGLILVYIFKKYHMRDTKKALIMLSAAILLTGMEDFMEGIIPIASLLGVMVVGFVLQEKYKVMGSRLGTKFNKIWVFAEIILFVLVGAEVNIYLALESGLYGLLLIFAGLLARGIGVLISLAGTDLNWKERIFSIIAYTPKATVQAVFASNIVQLSTDNLMSIIKKQKRGLTLPFSSNEILQKASIISVVLISIYIIILAIIRNISVLNCIISIIIFPIVPENKESLEIGVGTGKFTYPFGIKTGIDPSQKMIKHT